MIAIHRRVVDVAHDVRAAMCMRVVAMTVPLAVVVTMTLAIVVAMAIVAPVVAMAVTVACVVPVAVALMTAMITPVALPVDSTPVMTVMARRVSHRAAVIAHALVGTFMSAMAFGVTTAVAAMVIGTGKAGTQCQGQGQQQAGEQTTIRVFHDIPPS